MNSKKERAAELIAQAKLLFGTKQYERAVSLLQEAKKYDSASTELYDLLGSCSVLLGRYDEAKIAYQNLTLLDSKDGEAWFHLGNLALMAENTEEAKAHFSKAELLGFTEPVMYQSMAAAYERQGNYEKAVQQYSKVLRKKPYDLYTLDRKTQLQIRANHPEDALKTAKALVSADIDYFPGHHYVYVCLILLNKLQDALDYAELTRTQFPEEPSVLLDLVRIYDLTGHTEQALAFLEENYAQLSQFAAAEKLKLGLLLRLNRMDEADAWMNRSKAMQEDADALMTYFEVQFGQEKYASALEYAKRLQQLPEDTPERTAAIYFVPLAKKHLHLPEAEEELLTADRTLKALCMAEPHRVDAYLYRALVNYQLENYEEAKRLLEYLMAVSPDTAVFHLSAYAVYEALGEQEEAKRHYERAQELDAFLKKPLI